MAERKIVTLLFADLCGSTALVSQSDPEEAQVLLDRTLKTMAEAVETYGGSVRRLQGDGIVGLFGAPVAQEDHALRACLAALTLQRNTRNAHADEEPLDAPVRVGIHSGEVVVGSINDLLTSHHRVDGAALHLAARLEQLARPGSILVSGATARLLDGGLSLRPLGPRDIRGFDRPVELFELDADARAQTRPRHRPSGAYHSRCRDVTACWRSCRACLRGWRRGACVCLACGAKRASARRACWLSWQTTSVPRALTSAA